MNYDWSSSDQISTSTSTLALNFARDSLNLFLLLNNTYTKFVIRIYDVEMPGKEVEINLLLLA